MGRANGWRLEPAAQRLLQIRDIRETLILFQRQRTMKGCFHVKRDAGVERARRDEFPLLEHTIDAVGGRLAGQQGVECGGGSILIGPMVRPASAVLFRRRESGRQPLRARGRRALVEDFGQPKVDQHQDTVGLQLEIGRLDIPMDDRRLAGMQVGEGIAQGVRPVENFLHGGLLLLGARVQIDALDEIHHKVLTIFVDKVIGDTGQVRMTQPRQQVRFPLKLTF